MHSRGFDMSSMYLNIYSITEVETITDRDYYPLPRMEPNLLAFAPKNRPFLERLPHLIDAIRQTHRMEE
jgi:hypothetical protein